MKKWKVRLRRFFPVIVEADYYRILAPMGDIQFVQITNPKAEHHYDKYTDTDWFNRDDIITIKEVSSGN